MKFEWDKDKEKRNIRKHSISFDEAVTVFYDPVSATFADTDHSIEEDRFITIGYSSQGRLFVVSHTERGDAIRIINARPATISERKRHEN
ncbi:MAG TPA: BrnT family toxin [Syntrophales bacterium]|nr:BrnT family toxin [Syntrophales bacterium]